jgi:peptidoglycan/LPS O-acetylase OafA/YrhL
MKFQNVIKNDASFLLNLVRAISVQMVLVGHIFYWSGKNESLISIASFGVVLFFILSGILIANSLFAKNSAGNYSFGEYFIDRFARIYCGLFPCLLVIFLVDGIHLWINADNYTSMRDGVLNKQYSVRNFLGSLLMVQNIGVFPAFLGDLNIGYGFGSARPLWSLSIEWWLYLSFGWAVLRWPTVGAPARSLWYYYLILAAFSILPVFHWFSRDEIGGLVLVWFFGVGITILLNLLISAGVRPGAPYLYAGFFLVLLAIVRLCVFFQSPYSLGTGVLMLAGTFFLLFSLAESMRAGAGRLTKTVDFIAAYSYTLYLIHMPVILLLALWLRNNFTLYFIAAVLISNFLSALIALFTEMRYRTIARWMKTMFLHSSAN